MIEKSFLYQEFMSPKFRTRLLRDSKNPFGIKDFRITSECSGLESKKSLEFLISVYTEVRENLRTILDQRRKDRDFIDKRTSSFHVYNKNLKKDFKSSSYKTVIGEKDSQGRVVIGPLQCHYAKSNGKPITPLPEYLQGYHVTLFGPPDSEKMCINAMNAYHRKIKDEPAIIGDLLGKSSQTPKWGADSEDSKTPIHEDLVNSGVNLSKALEHDLNFIDDQGKEYKLEKEFLAHPIKRFPGLALPAYFLFYKEEPFPLHLYDFLLHAFKNYHNPQAMVFYVPKLENEEEARYIKKVMEVTEQKILKMDSNYKIGTIKLMIVLENPRAVFRVNEIIDELGVYFAGASLGWHDYLGSTARIFKNDPNYRIPVKADTDIVIKYIKASHELLSDIVGARGGVKVGGMYGILPNQYDLQSASFQVTLFGFFRDVITQLKRNLNGFWVAHPDFVRIGMAIVEAWKLKEAGDDSLLLKLFKNLLNEKYNQRIFEFLNHEDIKSLGKEDPLYARALLAAEIGESNIIANNDPKEIRYNIFQTLQYLTDWLSGNGCVALPTALEGTPVRVMDDLATSERSRWEVWHEIQQERFDLYEFLKIAHEEMLFIRKDLSDAHKVVQVKWTAENAKWYSVAFQLMIKLMTDKNPVEFATELLLPFTISSIRSSESPWQTALNIDSEKFQISDKINRFNYYFEICGDHDFSKRMSQNLIPSLDLARQLIEKFSLEQVLNAAIFHGDIGYSKKTLDRMAKREQESVNDERIILQELQELGKEYLVKFGFKYLVSAQGKSGNEMLSLLKERIKNSKEIELKAAIDALIKITLNRMQQYPLNDVESLIEAKRIQYSVKGVQVSLSLGNEFVETICLGDRDNSHPVEKETQFQIASLSKTVGTAIALDVLMNNDISLETSVNNILRDNKASLILESDEVRVKHLLNHTALNMHYVKGFSSAIDIPDPIQLLKGNEKWGYEPVEVINPPGQKFKYSGAGFIVLEYLLQLITKKNFKEVLNEYCSKWDLDFTLEPNKNFSCAYRDSGEQVVNGYLQFPAIAAGMFSSTHSMMEFLVKLGTSFKKLEEIKIPHEIAVNMLNGKNLGSLEFMNCLMGLGVFTAEAGLNRFMIHQGANDGYRALFLHCYDGPDSGKGFTVFSNAELNGVLLNSEIAKILLKEMNFKGINQEHFKSIFNAENLEQEQIVNLGYKELVFDSFITRLPEKIIGNTLDKEFKNNCLNQAKVVSVSNELFARAENLFSPFYPVFDPDAYGSEGKIMDSWETVRHNELDFDSLHLKLKEASNIEYVLASTEYHDGNHVEAISLDFLCNGSWKKVLRQTSLKGHSLLRLKLDQRYDQVTEVKISAYPDGGLTRLGLFTSVEDSSAYDGVSVRCSTKIPSAHGALKSKYEPTEQEVKENFSKIQSGDLYDLASLAYGATVLKASNEHYGPASRVISPYGPIDMFDGMESARSRIKNNFEFVKIKLSQKSKIKLINLDFKFFLNNNPKFIEILGDTEEDILVPKTAVKAFRGNKINFTIKSIKKFETITLKTYPDGGVNRIHVYGRK